MAEANSPTSENRGNSKPPNLHKWIQDNAGWLMLIAYSALLATLVLYPLYPVISLPVVVVVLAASVLTTILVFTRPLTDYDIEAINTDEAGLSDSNANTDTGDRESIESTRRNAPERINVLFRIAYGFCILIILLVVAYFFNDKPLYLGCEDCDKNNSSEDVASKDFRLKPVAFAIVPGCDYAVEQGRTFNPEQRVLGDDSLEGKRIVSNGMPPGILCGELVPQWVLSIGGSIMSCHLSGNCEFSQQNGKELDKSRKELQDARDKAKSTNRGHKACQTKRAGWKNTVAESQAILALDPYNDKARSRQHAARKKLLDTDIDCANQKALASAANDKLSSLQDRFKLLEDPQYRVNGQLIVGGVVVPLYFLVLAFLGALIHMVRQLPEFQRLSTLGYRRKYYAKLAVAEGATPPISVYQAREKIIFQIIQVLTAPIIAIVAYSWVRPEQLPAAIILGFSAGFSSELILKAIRGVLDRLLALGVRDGNVRTASLVEETRKKAGTNETKVAERVGEMLRKQFVSLTPLEPGQQVYLVSNYQVFKPGASGVVEAVDLDGSLTVHITRDDSGKAVSARIRAARSYFSTIYQHVLDSMDVKG